MRYAVVVDGIVVNSIVWDGKEDFPHEGELIKCNDDYTGAIGSTWDGETFTAPPEVPEVLDAAE